MQDEVSKHTRRVYKTIKNPKYKFGEKLREIIIEIFIIVFAVTLSIWFHSWSDHRHEQKEVKEFLKGLKDDLGQDIHQMENSKQVISRLNSNFYFLFELQRKGVEGTLSDSSLKEYLSFDLRITRPNIGRYEGFKSSGKMGTIESDSLKEDILTFYEQTIPNLVYGENYVNSIQTKLLDLRIETSDKLTAFGFVLMPRTKGLFRLGMSNFEVNIAGYDEAVKKIKKIITEIDQHLNE